MYKSGVPYIGHPARVAGRLETTEAQAVGWLHDTVEDTGLTLEEVEAQVGTETAAAVDAVSRRPGEEWETYLRQVKENPTACKVKKSAI